jgi:hypothetical protein
MRLLCFQFSFDTELFLSTETWPRKMQHPLPSFFGRGLLQTLCRDSERRVWKKWDALNVEEFLGSHILNTDPKLESHRVRKLRSSNKDTLFRRSISFHSMKLTWNHLHYYRPGCEDQKWAHEPRFGCRCSNWTCILCTKRISLSMSSVWMSESHFWRGYLELCLHKHHVSRVSSS